MGEACRVLDMPLWHAVRQRPRRSKSALDRATDATISLPHVRREVSAGQEPGEHANHNGHVAAGDAPAAAPRGRGGQHAADGTGAASPEGLASPTPEAGRLTLEQCRALLPPGFEVEDSELERVRDTFYLLAGEAVDAALGARLRQG